ncbi:unnamed protein product [Vitrella brassicaformis CCMP3155]|uniref:EF-hand domain-containing protein n=2 Tax=Vitrella brassicaformis TaxID=1169539 RepID=A0A0G4EGK8_VITBC|nr:unnamed protein product [Vitrella brassicaformis CCMP3155]|mmetsp:Transcript_34753/g.86184  ORF Transcript_34753/g.86184 Transcript_34753/m.86184 type:complete len:306 (+) Transcript_34753:143-1060(+)|eukprot:CEL94593.1 unnamed protein product [Vitrella brassicaformis CCMP3155]
MSTEKQNAKQRTVAFENASTTSTPGNDTERIVQLLKAWDTNQDGMFSIDEVTAAAKQMMSERKENKRLKWVIFGVVILYIVTIVLLLGITFAAVEMAKDFKPDENGLVIGTKATKNVIQTKAKTDVESPFDFITHSLDDLENLDGLYIDDLLAKNGDVLERYFKVRDVTKNKSQGSVKVVFLNGEYLEIDKERAVLLRPKPEGGCGGEADAADAPEGYCAVAEILNGPDPRDAEEPKPEDPARRQLQSRVSIVGPAYNRGPRGIGSNLNFNSGKVYDDDGIVSLGRARFFGQGQFRGCDGASCQF